MGGSHVSTMYGSNLDVLAQRTFNTWSMSGSDILARHTVFPYYSYYFEDLLAAAAAHTEQKAPKITFLEAGVPIPRHLRYCRSCARHDMSVFGESYWRRTHQLSGIFFCVEHQELLANSPFLASSVNQRLEDATSIAHREAEECVSLPEDMRSLAWDIALRCNALLDGTAPKWSRSQVHEEYRQSAKALGYGFGADKLRTGALASDFYEFYGADFLAKFGIKIAAYRNAAEKFMTGSVHHPLMHVLMQRFFEQMLVKTAQGSPKHGLNLDIAGGIRCPNPCAKHPPNFRIESVTRQRERKAREPGFAARCSCGFGFTFRQVDSEDPSIPIVLVRTAFGPAFEREARRLYKVKPVIRYVADTMGVNDQLAERLVKGQRNSREEDRPLDPSKIKRLRSEWKKTRSKAVYNKLWWIDRPWLLAQKKKRRPAPTKVPKPDPELDKFTALAIREAAAILHSATPPQHVSVKAICRHIEKPGLPSGLFRMPLSRTAMDEVTESKAEWLRRGLARNA